jgi:hypothetical protein
MSDFLLVIHNIWRWVVLIMGLIAVLTAWFGWLAKRNFTAMDRKFGTFFGISLDIQLLIGIILYFVSPLVQGILANFGDAMGAQETRFFGLEHAVYMIVAVLCVHLGSMLVKRAQGDQAKFRRAALWYTVTLAIILIGIPWWRPLLRL